MGEAIIVLDRAADSSGLINHVIILMDINVVIRHLVRHGLILVGLAQSLKMIKLSLIGCRESERSVGQVMIGLGQNTKVIEAAAHDKDQVMTAIKPASSPAFPVGGIPLGVWLMSIVAGQFEMMGNHLCLALV